MGVKVVIFDFWGTLVSTGTWSPLKQSLSILRLKMTFGQFVPRFEKVFMTQKFADQREAFTKVCEEFNVKPLPIVIEKLIGVWNKNKILAKPFDETIETLDWLKEKEYKMVVLSNTDCFGVDQVIEKFNMKDYFEIISCSYNTGLLKTDPKVFDQIIEQLGVGKDEVVMVGDSVPSDMVGAEKAGVRGILVDRKGRREYEGKITTLTELKEVL